jgi:hypothetical protein
VWKSRKVESGDVDELGADSSFVVRLEEFSAHERTEETARKQGILRKESRKKQG